MYIFFSFAFFIKMWLFSHYNDCNIKVRIWTKHRVLVAKIASTCKEYSIIDLAF